VTCFNFLSSSGTILGFHFLSIRTTNGYSERKTPSCEKKNIKYFKKKDILKTISATLIASGTLSRARGQGESSSGRQLPCSKVTLANLCVKFHCFGLSPAGNVDHNMIALCLSVVLMAADHNHPATV
jgi:hypothetical protein